MGRWFGGGRVRDSGGPAVRDLVRGRIGDAVIEHGLAVLAHQAKESKRRDETERLLSRSDRALARSAEIIGTPIDQFVPAQWSREPRTEKR